MWEEIASKTTIIKLLTGNLNKLTSSFNNYETKTETYNLNNFLSQIQQLNPYTVLLEWAPGTLI